MRSLCRLLSSWVCFVNWLSGFPEVEHSGPPPRKDMADSDDVKELGVLDNTRQPSTKCDLPTTSP